LLSRLQARGGESVSKVAVTLQLRNPPRAGDYCSVAVSTAQCEQYAPVGLGGRLYGTDRRARDHERGVFFQQELALLQQQQVKLGAPCHCAGSGGALWLGRLATATLQAGCVGLAACTDCACNEMHAHTISTCSRIDATSLAGAATWQTVCDKLCDQIELEFELRNSICDHGHDS